MKRILFLILMLASSALFAQTGQPTAIFTFPYDSAYVRLTNSDTVYVWYALPINRARVDSAVIYKQDSAAVPVHMLPAPFGGTNVWNYNFYAAIKPTAVTADTESDSLQVYMQPADEHGNVMTNDIRYFDFSSSANTNKTVKTLNWTSAAWYGAASAGEAVAASFIRFTFIQYAKNTGQTTNIPFKIKKN